MPVSAHANPTVLAFKALRALCVLGALPRACGDLERCAAAGFSGVAGNFACACSGAHDDFFLFDLCLFLFDRLGRLRHNLLHDALRVMVGESAPALYEAHDRSLMKLAEFARSLALPACQRLATGLQLAHELLAEEMSLAPAFDSPTAVADYLKLHFAGQTHESFVVMFLSAQHHLLAFEAMFRGTLTQTSVYPREVIKQALHHNAAAVILAHNHPSGSTEPSRADEVLTRTLSTALALVDVRVLDHLIIAGGCSLSMAERGLL